MKLYYLSEDSSRAQSKFLNLSLCLVDRIKQLGTVTILQ